MNIKVYYRKCGIPPPKKKTPRKNKQTKNKNAEREREECRWESKLVRSLFLNYMQIDVHFENTFKELDLHHQKIKCQQYNYCRYLSSRKKLQLNSSQLMCNMYHYHLQRLTNDGGLTLTACGHQLHVYKCMHVIQSV